MAMFVCTKVTMYEIGAIEIRKFDSLRVRQIVYVSIRHQSSDGEVVTCGGSTGKKRRQFIEKGREWLE